jgi:hypothetical protein
MKSTTCIHEDVFISILEKMFCLLTEAGSHPYGCIGIFSTVANTVTVCTHGRCNAERVAELKEYLIDIKEGVKKKIPGTDRFPMATPHAIVAYQIGECVIASYSPAGDPWDEAVSATYGHYHQLQDIYEGAIDDDMFVDRLLLSIGEWQKNSESHNEVIVRLAQSVFKPEIVLYA